MDLIGLGPWSQLALALVDWKSEKHGRGIMGNWVVNRGGMVLGKVE